MIRGLDGTPYELSGSLSTFDPNDTEERQLLSDLDAEIIRITGSPILYFEILIDVSTIDKLFHEARSAIFNPNPVELFAAWSPLTSMMASGLYGIDSFNMQTFELNYDATVKAIGGIPKIGSRIRTVLRNEDWVITSRGAGDWKLWSQIRMTLECSQFQDSSTRNASLGSNDANIPPYVVN